MGVMLKYVKDNQHPQQGYEVKQLPVSIGPNDSFMQLLQSLDQFLFGRVSNLPSPPDLF